jgi:trehalose 6-phosphate synthase
MAGRDNLYPRRKKHSAVPIALHDELADSHYNGFSSKFFIKWLSKLTISDSTLWPLLHYQSCFTFNRSDWHAYEEVNEIFANRIAADCVDGDIVWVHDYHLLLVPSLLRQKVALLNKRITIGFFLHTPFPASDQFRILPVCKNILEGVLGSDMIGFHTSSYNKNFNSACVDIL